MIAVVLGLAATAAAVAYDYYTMSEKDFKDEYINKYHGCSDQASWDLTKGVEGIYNAMTTKKISILEAWGYLKEYNRRWYDGKLSEKELKKITKLIRYENLDGDTKWVTYKYRDKWIFEKDPDEFIRKFKTAEMIKDKDGQYRLIGRYRF